MEKSGKDMRILYDLSNPVELEKLLRNIIKGDKGTDKQSEAQQDAVRNLFKKLKIEEAERANAKKLIEKN